MSILQFVNMQAAFAVIIIRATVSCIDGQFLEPYAVLRLQMGGWKGILARAMSFMPSSIRQAGNR